MNNIKKVKSEIKSDGDGAKIKRLFPGEDYNGHHDPFVLMDEFMVEAPASFPAHEHRGFEAITYMFEGSFVHEDNLGNKAEVKKGGVQAFNAGKGITHSEKPGSEGHSHGIQLWINLPTAQKKSDPSYFQLEKTEVIKEEKGILIKEVIGEEMSANLNTNINYLDIKIKAQQTFSSSIKKKNNAILYLVKGKFQGKENLNSGEGLLLTGSINLNLKSIENSAHFILITGEPLNQPIKINGTYVE